MRVNLRGDGSNGTHTKFTVFMNGANCGQLCMTEEEAVFFHDVILRTSYKIPEDDLYSTGVWFKKEEKR